MPNGKPGDHPLTDVVVWGREVYGPDIDPLVREVAALLGQTYGDLSSSPLGKPPLVDLIIAAETDPSTRPALRDGLVIRRARLVAERRE
jgi:hypothetical protein